MPTLQPVSDRPGVNYVEVREHLYFSTYSYRATMKIEGARWVTVKFATDAKQFKLWKKNNPREVVDYRVRIEGSNVSVFSNDLALLLTLNSFYTAGVTITQAIPTERRNEIKYCAREPKHRYRMYFKSFMSNVEVNEIKQLIEEQKSHIHWTHSLKRAILSTGYYNSHFYGTYINVDEESIVTFILMKYDHLFKRVVQLEKMPEITGMINTL